MARKFSERDFASDDRHSSPRPRGPLVFVVASDRAYLQTVFSQCAEVPPRYEICASLTELRRELSRRDRIDLAFAVIVETSADRIDPLELRSCKLELPQINYVVILGECDATSLIRLQSMGVQNVILPPFSEVNVAGEIATALPNLPQFKRHPDLMKRGLVRLDFLIPSDLTFVLGVNHIVSLLLREFSFSPADARVNIPLACDEALTNAILHGNAGDADKKVSVQIYLSTSRFKIRIRDQGPGFDVSRLGDPRKGENLMRSSGRGVYLMRSIMDRVEFKEGGRVVELEKENAAAHANAHPGARRP